MYTAIGVSTVNVALAQTPAAQTTAAETNVPPRRYDIPAGLMGTVLDAYQQRSGVQVTLPLQGVRDLRSSGVSGVYTAQQAIEQILKDTGMVYHFTGQKSVTVEPDRVLASVDVNAHYTAVSTSMPKYTEPLTDTPQSISIIPRNVIEEQNVTTLRDTLRNVAGISMAAGEGGSQGDNLTIRGFSARNDLFIDGMRDFGHYYRDPFNLEEVEVLQGPSSVTFGRGSTGGVVNQATKSPSLTKFVDNTLDLGAEQRRFTSDVNIPLERLGTGDAFRLNLMGDDGHVPGRDEAKFRRFGIAPSLSLGLGTPTRFTFSYLHQMANDVPDYGIPWLFNGPAPVNRHNYYGFKDANFLRTYVDIGNIRAEHDFGSHFTLRNQVRYSNYVRHAQITEAKTTGTVTLATPLESIRLNRNQLAAESTESSIDEQLDLTTRFETGFLHHTLMTGVEVARDRSDPTRLTYAGMPGTSLLDPNEDDPFTGYTVSTRSIVHTTANSAAVYVLDTVKLGRRWDFTGGWRWDRFNAHYTQAIAPASAFNRLDTKPTWRGAVVFKPAQSGSIYFSAGTSFNPSAESLSLSAATANLPPEENRTFEAGTKWDFLTQRLSFRTAVFRTEKTNAREPDPNDPQLNVLSGNQRVDGIQVEGSGRIMKNWNLLASYAYLDAKVTSSDYYPAAIGARLGNVPANTFNLWNTWQLPWHFESGFGMNFVSSRTASSTSPNDPVTGLVKQVPSYWVFNAMLEHSIAEHVTVQANAKNLTNRYYYDQLHPGHVVLGPARSLLIGLKFKF
jgi:catecholate siderophore receptor